MPAMPISHKKPHHKDRDLNLSSKGRVITLGVSHRKRERVLLTALGVVSLALITLLGTEAWLFHNGTIQIVAKPEMASVTTITPKTSQPPVSLGSSVTPTTISKNAVPATSDVRALPAAAATMVPATMAPTPANGKFEDIVLPAEKPGTISSSLVKDVTPSSLKKLPEEAHAPQAPVVQPLPTTAEQVPTTAPSEISNKERSVASSQKVKTVSHARLSKAAARNPELDQARSKLDHGDYAGALILYDRVLDHNAKNYDALTGKVSVLQHTEQFDAAIAIEHQLISLDPDNQEIRQNLVTLLGQQNSAASVAELQKIVARDPQNSSAQATLTRLLEKRGASTKP